MSPEAASTAAESKTEKLVQRLSGLVDEYSRQHQTKSALFWSGQLVSFSKERPECVIRHAEALYADGQYQRAAYTITSRGLDKSDLRGCYLAARAIFDAKDLEEALQILDGATEVFEDAQKELEEGRECKELRRTLSSVFLLRGKIWESLDNRALASQAFRDALVTDVYCVEAFQALTQHNILSAAEEKELLKSMPLKEQLEAPSKVDDDFIDEEGSELLRDLLPFLYKCRLKKYDQPSELEIPDGPLRDHLSCNTDVVVASAEASFYNCDFGGCLRLTSGVLKEDPYHTECLPVHVSCLVQTNNSNELFHLAQKLVELYPEWCVAWFAVGSYYYLIGKQEFARRYLCKATQLDRVFGPAWLTYGHSFAVENEHDQAMAAYFKACQLMKGCHLPLLYTGVEYGLTNNSKLAERFFSQALEIAPNDPFVLHELGVTSFQKSEYPEAERYFLRALQILKQVGGSALSQSWEPLLNNLGHTARKLLKYEESIGYHRQALVLRPLSASTYSSIGYVHALRGDLLEAIESFHKALGIRRDDTFSTTVLNFVVERMIGDDPPYSGELEDIPKLEYPSSSDVLNNSTMAAGSSTSKVTNDSSLDIEMCET